MNRRNVIAGLWVAMLCSFFVMEPVYAAGDVFKDEHTVIEPGQKVENVIVFGNDADIKGSVEDGVVVIDGDLTIRSSAKIHGLVLVIGGDIKQEPGAKVTENVLSFAFGKGTSFGFLLAGVVLAASWLTRLGLSLLFLILSFIAWILLKEKLEPFQESIGRSPWKLILIGAVTSVLLMAVALLLVISVIGIPVAVVLFILPFVFFFIGLAAIGHLIGKNITGMKEKPVWLNVLYGAFIVVACVNFPFLGELLLLGLTWLSTGLMVMWLYERFQSRKNKSL